MSRTQAVLPGGPRLYPIESVRKALASCGRGSRRQRALPAEAMVYYVVALGLFRSVSAREVLRCLDGGSALGIVRTQSFGCLGSHRFRGRGPGWDRRRSRRCGQPG